MCVLQAREGLEKEVEKLEQRVREMTTELEEERDRAKQAEEEREKRHNELQYVNALSLSHTQ